MGFNINKLTLIHTSKTCLVNQITAAFSVTYIAIFLHPSFDVLFEMSQSETDVIPLFVSCK